jgi:hypothetical protein
MEQILIFSRVRLPAFVWASAHVDMGWTVFVNNRILIFIVTDRPVELKELKILI